MFRRRDNRPLSGGGGGGGCCCHGCFRGELLLLLLLLVVVVVVVRKAENLGMANGETAVGAVPGWAVIRWRERKRESGKDDDEEDGCCDLGGA